MKRKTVPNRDNTSAIWGSHPVGGSEAKVSAEKVNENGSPHIEGVEVSDGEHLFVQRVERDLDYGQKGRLRGTDFAY